MQDTVGHVRGDLVYLLKEDSSLQWTLRPTMNELRMEDQQSFFNIFMISPDRFDELLKRVSS